MSLIHDALRRGAGTRSGSRTAHADSVLRTLGYRRRPTRVRVLGLVALPAGVAAIAYAAWTWPAGPEDLRSSPPRATVAVRPAPRAVPSAATTPTAASAPARPEPLQTSAPVEATVHTAPERTDRKAPASSTRDDFQLALYFQRAGDLERARLHYRAVLRQNEFNAEAHNNLGLLARDQGRLDEAVEEFQRALAINPRYIHALNNLGATRLAQGRPDAAAAELNAALAIDGDNADALVNLALARKAAGEPGEARRLLMRALSVDPRSAAAHYNLAVQFDAAGEAPRAIEHYRAFLQFAGAEYADRTADVRARLALLDGTQ